MNATIVSLEKIMIIDNVIIGNNHLVINSGIINMAQNFFKKNTIASEVVFFGEKSHMDILANLIDRNESCMVSFCPIEVIQPESGKIQKSITWLKKLIKDKQYIGKLFEMSFRHKPRLIIVSCMIPINFLSFVSKTNNRLNQKFLVFIHGEVELLFQNKLSLKEKINKYFLEKSLKKISSNVKLIVFSDYIKNALAEKFNFKDHQIISINHPIQKYTRSAEEISNCINFAHIGVANKRKNSELIFKLADTFADSVKSGSCKFSIIGRVEEHEIKNVNDFVTVEAKRNQPIPNDTYVELVSKADYSLVFLPEEEYVYRISGSLLDSIQFQIPIIALKHVFVKELFEKGGDIGFMCNSFVEMQEVVKQINTRNPEFIDRYHLQVINLKKLSNNFYYEKASNIINTELVVWGE
jgi:glycosyltransferase involved in cell wall biosynthesis